MSKIKLLYGIIAFLLLLNLSLLVFVLKSNQGEDLFRPNPRNPRELIIKQLQSDEAQQAQFEKNVKWHHANIQKLDDSIRSVRKQLYRLLQNSTPDTRQKSLLLQQFSALQLQVEATHWQHFLAIKQLCRPDQMDNFNELTEQLMQLFSRGGRPPHRPKNE